ncbi:MAG: STAS domain-containing protein [Candidatus Sulfotelmatobacter sp.]
MKMYTKSPVIVMELPEKLTYTEGQTLMVELQPLLEADRPRIVLDCSKVEHMDSAGIEILLRCMEEAMKRDGDLKLAAVSPMSAAIMELMRVDRLFEVFDTSDEAARSFQAVAVPETQQDLPWYSTAYGLTNLKSA